MSGSMGSKGDRSPVDGYRERWRRGGGGENVLMTSSLTYKGPLTFNKAF